MWLLSRMPVLLRTVYGRARHVTAPRKARAMSTVQGVSTRKRGEQNASQEVYLNRHPPHTVARLSLHLHPPGQHVGPERGVDGGGHGHCVAVIVHNGYVGGAVVVRGGAHNLYGSGTTTDDKEREQSRRECIAQGVRFALEAPVCGR